MACLDTTHPLLKNAKPQVFFSFKTYDLIYCFVLSMINSGMENICIFEINLNLSLVLVTDFFAFICEHFLMV